MEEYPHITTDAPEFAGIDDERVEELIPGINLLVDAVNDGTIAPGDPSTVGGFAKLWITAQDVGEE